MRWHPLLKEIRARRLELARLDPRAGMPVLPPGGATPFAIAAVERRLGRPLPPSYRQLLSLHDGIPHFYQGVSLLSAHHLTRGTFVDLTRLVIDLGEISRVESARGRGPTLVPFGIDALGETIFAWDTSAPGSGGELGVVLWMNEIGERAESFPIFLELVLAMLEGDIADRRRALEPISLRCAAMAEAILSAGVESSPAPPVSGVRSLEEDEDDRAFFAA
jgi:hypothetical protein